MGLRASLQPDEEGIRSVFASSLLFRSGKRLPLILQTEAAECGLGCLAMVSSYYGRITDLSSLRSRFPLSMKGATLNHLIEIATGMDFSPRPVKVEMASLHDLRLPAILHWNFNHFVVLKKINRQKVEIHDPSVGARTLTKEQVSRHFTGIALELTPTQHFEKKTETRRLKLFDVVKSLPGIGKSLGYIFVLAFALQIFSIITPFFMQLVVDSAIVSEDYDLLSILAIGFLLLTLIQVTVTAIRSWVVMVLSTSLDFHLHNNMFMHLLRLPVAFFEKRHLGDVISRFDSLNNIQKTFTNGFIESIIDGLMVFVTLGVMLFYSGQMTAIVILAAVLYGVMRTTLYHPLRRASEEQIVHGAKQQSHFLETVRGVQSIKLFNREPLRNTRYSNLMIENYNAGVRVQKLNILFRSFNGALFGIENILVIWLGGLWVLNGSFSVGMLFAFMAYKRQFISRIVALIDRLVDFKMLGLHLERVSDIALESSEQNQIGMRQPDRFSISVKDISYRYGDSEPFTLEDVNFSIKEGESLAIVGPSGCGKTTLVKIMLGLLKPCMGEVFIGDIPLSKIDPKAYRDQIASVMQEDQLFAGSILDNITFFDPQADMESIANCASIAAIHHEIEAMPMGYNTLIGDMGTVLSSGQKQRILLARALYKQPKILYMDEATSHLDVASEKKVNEALQHLNITTVIIAHRPQTIASVERVIYLGPGGAKEASPQTKPATVTAAPGSFGPTMQTPAHSLP